MPAIVSVIQEGHLGRADHLAKEYRKQGQNLHPFFAASNESFSVKREMIKRSRKSKFQA
jgi:hypothetical protein